MRPIGSRLVLVSVVVLEMFSQAYAATANVPLYGVHELSFKGPHMTARDCPARDVELVTLWKHEDSGSSVRLCGFWDGDGKGAPAGNVYKVRFCPPRQGVWTLVETKSNRSELKGRKQGYSIRCTASNHPGFWIPDAETRGRWYRRSGGSHPYIFGDTLYSFLSEYKVDGPTGGNIRDDVINTSKYFNKIRFSISPDRYPHPRVKPFLDDDGRPTDDGSYCHRPNPAWWSGRVDLAVQTAFEMDQIADLILNGPDAYESRCILKAAKNGGDATPYLRYIAARYGSYPNVWICLCNEFDIKKPNYSTKEIVRLGTTMRKFLPNPTSMSVHAKQRDWYRELNEGPWHDHVIIQKKIKTLPVAADWVSRNYAIGGNVPVIDDELAYEGKGDGWSEGDVIESHLGAFLGGGYGTTGHKPASKQGHYFWGNFKPEEHLAADNLKWLREQIDNNITFWKMSPAPPAKDDGGRTSIFSNVHAEFRAMQWRDHEYVLGSNRPRSRLKANLPAGRWTVTRYDVVARKQRVLHDGARDAVEFDTPDSRAVLFHFKRR